MIQLTRKRRVDPASPRYFQVGGTWFRRPFAIHAQQLITAEPVILEYLSLVRSLEAAKELPDEETRLLEQIHLKSPRHYELLAAVIGFYWWDPDQELETRYDGDMRGYGVEVLAELEEAGWDVPRISAAGSKCFLDYIEDRQQQSRVREAAEERVNFS